MLNISKHKQALVDAAFEFLHFSHCIVKFIKLILAAFAVHSLRALSYSTLRDRSFILLNWTIGSGIFKRSYSYKMGGS